MAVIFNAKPKKAHNSVWKDSVIIPYHIAQLWAKVEPEVEKYNRYFKEKMRPTPEPHPRFRAAYNRETCNLWRIEESRKIWDEAVQPCFVNYILLNFI